MRKINLLFAVVLLSLVLLSVASLTFGQTTKKTLELPEFKSIYVNSNYRVYLKQTNKQEVTVEALADIYALTEVKVENGVLHINVERKPDAPNKSIWSKIDDIKLSPTMNVFVSMQTVNELRVNGGGSISSENSIASDQLLIGISGSGSVDLDLKGAKVRTDLSGSGNAKLKGYAASNEIIISGSGSLKAFELALESADVKMSGSGSCEITVTSKLDATVLGSGTLKHKGNTKDLSKKVYGSGSIERAY